MYETIETKCFNDRGMLLYVSLSLFLTKTRVFVEYSRIYFVFNSR